MHSVFKIVMIIKSYKFLKVDKYEKAPPQT